MLTNLSRLLWMIAFCSITAVTIAAGKTEKVDRVVDAVLEQETRGDVHRREDQLGDFAGQSDRARWAAGYVRAADGWQKFDVTPGVDGRIREYEQRRGTGPLTAEQHLQLANWCREQQLTPQERAHLWAMSSGPSRGDSGAIFRRLGYVNTAGEWMTPRERQSLLQQQRQREEDVKTWTPRAARILRHLSSANPQTQAIGRAELAEIKDLRAATALEAALASPKPEVSAEFIAWCRQIRGIDTTLALARLSLLAPSESTRNLAADALRARPLEQYVPPLLSVVAKPVEAKVLTTSTGLGRGNVVLAIQFQKETWNTIEISNYQVRSAGFTPRGTFPRSEVAITATMVNNTVANRNRIDLDRAIQDEVGRRTTQIAARNEAQQELNNRVAQCLSIAANMDRRRQPAELWAWWDRETASESTPAAEKPVTTSTEVGEFVPVPALQPTVSGGLIEVSETGPRKECLAAGTQITTVRGPRPVESLLIGDLVLAKDIETGELSYQPVIRTTVRSPQPLITLHTKDDSIRATLGHYFWVSGQGWRMAKEIKPGDRIHSVEGTATVTDISHGGREAVYNLVVEGANTYFVSVGKILSHDVTPPMPTDIIVPGLAAR